MYKDLIDEISCLSHDKTFKIVFSKTASETIKAVIKPIIHKRQKAWQCEKIFQNAAFHENIPESSFRSFLDRLLEENPYKHIHIITLESLITYRVSKKLTLHRTISSNKTALKPSFDHDRKKNYLLTDGMMIQPLVDLGVFTQDFRIVKAKYNKFRQINSFLEIINSGFNWDTGKKLNIVEFGCGKSYLTFILYHYLVLIKKMDVKITGYDIKSEEVDLCNRLAQKYEYKNLVFKHGDISKITLCQSKIDIFVTLHACDTATDYALYHAIQKKVKFVFSVPCCHKELNAQIHSDEYSILMRHGLIKERFASLLTDCIRCELLRYSGYAVDMVEFVGEENTPKNIMIRARYTGHRKNNMEEIQKLTAMFNAEQTLFKLVNKS